MLAIITITISIIHSLSFFFINIRLLINHHDDDELSVSLNVILILV